MKELFLTYDKALKIKELGFNEPCLGYFKYKKLFYEVNNLDSQKKCEYVYDGILAPLYTQGVEFLVTYGVIIRISMSGIGYEVRRIDWPDLEYDWYEDKIEAFDAGLRLI